MFFNVYTYWISFFPGEFFFLKEKNYLFFLKKIFKRPKTTQKKEGFFLHAWNQDQKEKKCKKPSDFWKVETSENYFVWKFVGGFFIIFFSIHLLNRVQ